NVALAAAVVRGPSICVIAIARLGSCGPRTPLLLMGGWPGAGPAAPRHRASAAARAPTTEWNSRSPTDASRRRCGEQMVAQRHGVLLGEQGGGARREERL